MSSPRSEKVAASSLASALQAVTLLKETSRASRSRLLCSKSSTLALRRSRWKHHRGVRPKRSGSRTHARTSPTANVSSAKIQSLGKGHEHSLKRCLPQIQCRRDRIGFVTRVPQTQRDTLNAFYCLWPVPFTSPHACENVHPQTRALVRNCRHENPSRKDAAAPCTRGSRSSACCHHHSDRSMTSRPVSSTNGSQILL